MTSSPSASKTDHGSARSQATRVTLIGMFLDIFLGITKLVGGTVTQSFALVTDGIHSLTDAITDIFVLIVARVANTAPDQNHPYGHGRFETLGTIAMGILFFVTAGILLYDSYTRLRLTEALPIPAPAALGIALLSIAGKEWIYHYTMRVAKRLDSSLLLANAWHSRSDAISSIAVLIGLLAAQQGYVWMDTVAGIFVSLIIAKVGWELCADSLKELVDTAVPQQRQQQIEACIRSVPGVQGITNIRTRSSGGKIILEVHLLVNPRISVSEGHQIGDIVSRSVTGNFSDIGDVIVHIDPVEHGEEEFDASAFPNLPPREEVLGLVRKAWGSLLQDEDIDRLLLHYLENGVEVELTLKNEDYPQQHFSQLEAAVESIECVCRLRIYHKLFESYDQRSLS